MNDNEVIRRLRPLLSERRVKRVEEVLARRVSSIVAVLDNLHDAQNISAIVRSCEALGVGEIHLIEATERIKLRRRVTQGCHKWIDLVRHEESAPCLEALKARGFLVYGAEPKEDALPLQSLPLSTPLALVFGAEHAGLRPQTRALLDGSFQIPMCGFTRSLNASVAAAISLFETTTRWREARGVPGDLSEEEKLRLRARFYRDSVRGARLIIAMGGDEQAIRAEKRRRLLQKKGE